MIVFSDSELNVLDGDTQRIGVFFRLATDPVIRLWLGVGPCAVGINTEDPSGAIYSGLGELINVPPVQQLINGVAERVEFSVSGVSENVLRLASTEANDVKGAACALGVGVFDKNWQFLGSPKWLFNGTADYVSLSQQSGEGGAIRTISLSVGSLFTGRRRRGYSYLTDQDQQARRPGDRFCERTVLYSREHEKRWPVPT